MDESELRSLIPGVLAAVVRRGADFATAERNHLTLRAAILRGGVAL